MAAQVAEHKDMSTELFFKLVSKSSRNNIEVVRDITKGKYTSLIPLSRLVTTPPCKLEGRPAKDQWEAQVSALSQNCVCFTGPREKEVFWRSTEFFFFSFCLFVRATPVRLIHSSLGREIKCEYVNNMGRYKNPFVHSF